MAVAARRSLETLVSLVLPEFSPRHPAMHRGHACPSDIHTLAREAFRLWLSLLTGSRITRHGEVPERPNGPDSKSGVRSRVPRVRIPPSPPFTRTFVPHEITKALPAKTVDSNPRSDPINRVRQGASSDEAQIALRFEGEALPSRPLPETWEASRHTGVDREHS